jgi:opacity protein-like surface antigen
MNSICRVYLLCVLMITFAAKRTSAQFMPSKYEAGINIGSLIYQGDLSRGALGYTKSLKPEVGVYVARSLDEYFSARATLAFGTIDANDLSYSSPEYLKYRALSFSSSVAEFSGQLVYHFLGNTSVRNDSRFSPYVFAGLGLSFLNIKRNWSKFDAAYFAGESGVATGLGTDTLHKVPGVIPVIPVGVGVQYLLTPQIALTAEWTYRITETDYLDGFSHVADPKKNDYYYGFTIGVSYRFGNNRMDCPKVVK